LYAANDKLDFMPPNQQEKAAVRPARDNTLKPGEKAALIIYKQ